MKIYNILMMFAMICIVYTSLVSAIAQEDISYFFKSGENFDIKRECFFDGYPCDPGTYDCNLTVYYPNMTTYFANGIMTGGTAYWNYTVYPTNIPQGNYRCSMYCSDGVYNGSEVFWIQVNGTGDDRNNTLLYLMVIGAIFCLFIAMKFENEYLGFLSGGLFIVTGVYTMIYGISYLSNMYTQAVSFTSLGLGIIFSVIAGYKIIEGNANSGGFDFDSE